MNTWLRMRLFDVLLLLLIGLIPYLWFPEGAMVTGHDAGYPINIIETFKDRLYTWNTVESFGRDNTVNVGAIPIHAIEAGWHIAGLSLYDAQKMTFICWFWIILFSMYYFALTLRQSIPYRFFPLIAAVLYGVNFYLLALWRYGAGTTFSAYAALPLFMAQVIRLFEGRVTPFRASILLSLVLFIFNGGAGFSVPLFGGIIVAFLTSLVFFFFMEKSAYRVKLFFRIGITVFLVIIFSVCLHAYWLLPFINYVYANYATDVAVHGGSSGIIAWTDAVSKFTSFANLFRLQGFPDWYEEPHHAYASVLLSQPLLVIISCLFAPLAYGALLIRTHVGSRKILLLFVCISLVALFLAAGTHEPTRWAFIQFIKYIPGFAIFRSAQYKFIPALYFSFAILISVSVNYLIFDTKFIRSLRNTYARVITAVVAVCIIGIILVYHYPYFTRSFFTYNKPLTTLLTIPPYIFVYDAWTQSHVDKEKRILILPPLSLAWKSEAYTWKYFSLYSLFNLLSPAPFVEYSQTQSDAHTTLIRRLSFEALHNGPLLEPLASILQTQYALIRGDSEHSADWIRSDDPTNYFKAFEAHAFPRLWQEGKWGVYELPHPVDSGKIYSVESVTKLVGPQHAILGPFIDGREHFFQTDVIDGRQTNPSAAHVPIDSTIHALSCRSCVYDTDIATPETYATVLPSSPLYPIKAWRERNLENLLLPPKELAMNRLSLSFKRAIELQAMVALHRDTSTIERTADQLESHWKNISDTINAFPIGGGDSDLIRHAEAYAKRQKHILISSYIERDDKSIKQMLQRILAQLDTILLRVGEHRQYWLARREYALPGGLGQSEIFADVLSFNRDNLGNPILPHTVHIGEREHRINASVIGEKVSLGQYNFSDANAIQLIFPTQTNVAPSYRVESVIGPDATHTCVIRDVLSYDSQDRYRITLQLSRILPSEVRLFLDRHKRGEVKTAGKTTHYLTKSDYVFSVDSTSLLPQYFTFSGEEGDAGASVLFCSPASANPKDMVENVDVEKIAAPIVYIRDDAGSPNQKVHPVQYKKIDQTKYELDFQNTTFPLILVFNENYSNQWKLYGSRAHGNSSVWDMVTGLWQRKPLERASHFTMYGFANAWYLPERPEQKITIEFFPQSIFYAGIVVTIVSIVLVVAMYCYRFIWMRRNIPNGEKL